MIWLSCFFPSSPPPPPTPRAKFPVDVNNATEIPQQLQPSKFLFVALLHIFATSWAFAPVNGHPNQICQDLEAPPRAAPFQFELDPTPSSMMVFTSSSSAM